jgi:pyridoxamine 5'-phosphate oxidase
MRDVPTCPGLFATETVSRPCQTGRMSHDLAAERMDYLGAHLLESEAPDDPYVLFERWLADAFAAKERGVLPEPTAMVVATSSDGRPSARTVLLKEATPRGFVFFTNYDSHKGAELASNPLVALHFGWYPLQRQVRVEGTAARVPRSESEAYFATRPRGSQLGAWASAQSSEVESLDALTGSYAAVEERFADQEVPCPEHWGGYRVTPELVEFWQGQPSRMHDRLVYRRSDEGWRVSRLAP